VLGCAIWATALLLSGSPLAMLSRGWGLVIGASFVALTLARPAWDVTSRAIAAIAAASAIGGVGLLTSGLGPELDALFRVHFQLAAESLAQLQARFPTAVATEELRAATMRIAEFQAEVFPALLALQSLAALALAAWLVGRSRRSESGSFTLARLTEFRFNDQLIWVVLAGFLVFLLPAGPLFDRVALNALIFMGGLYALRGFAIFVFLAKGSRSIPTMLFGMITLLFLYQLAFTATILMGVGDTWLDVRRRLVPASPV
jgi:hypothetical protein